LLLRRSYSELHLNHIIPLQGELYGFAQYKAEEKCFIFPNNSRLKLGYCDSESDVYQFQGAEFPVVAFEEATLLTESQIQFILTCNRSVRSDFKARAYFSCNPGGPSHNLIKRWFIDKDYLPHENPADFTFVQASVYDNDILMQNNPEYIQTLEQLPEELKRAHLYGDWDCFAGQFNPSFDKRIHVITPFQIPAWWKRCRSLDYGLDMTACIWWAIADNGQCFAYRELHEPNLALSQAAKKITEMTPKDEHISYTVASPDLWSRRQETGASGIEIMGKAGLKGLIKARHDRVQGWRVMREHLQPYERFDEEGNWILDEQGNPKKTAQIQIFPNCTNLIKYIPMLQHDEHNVEDAASKPHIVTHINESCRYFCMSRHPEFSVQDRLTFPPGTSAADIERIRSNMEFEKVYSKMQNRNKV
jgi:phage terminase large subunit